MSNFQKKKFVLGNIKKKYKNQYENEKFAIINLYVARIKQLVDKKSIQYVTEYHIPIPYKFRNFRLYIGKNIVSLLEGYNNLTYDILLKDEAIRWELYIIIFSKDLKIKSD